MEFVELPSAPEQIRSLGWKLKKTFQTPLKQVDSFVNAIVANGEPQSAHITIDQVVFEPKEWISVLSRYSLEPKYGSGVAVRCSGDCEVRELLAATFAGWIDFAYVPSPKLFVIYVDHDEYATFYANTESNLNSIARALEEIGVEAVDYTRYL